MSALVKSLHPDEKVKAGKLGSNRRDQIVERETAALSAPPTSDMRGLLR